MSRIISRKPAGQQLRVIIDIAPGETLVVIPASAYPKLVEKVGDGTAQFYPAELITNPAK